MPKKQRRISGCRMMKEQQVHELRAYVEKKIRERVLRKDEHFRSGTLTFQTTRKLEEEELLFVDTQIIITRHVHVERREAVQVISCDLGEGRMHNICKEKEYNDSK